MAHRTTTALSAILLFVFAAGSASVAAALDRDEGLAILDDEVKTDLVISRFSAGGAEGAAEIIELLALDAEEEQRIDAPNQVKCIRALIRMGDVATPVVQAEYKRAAAATATNDQYCMIERGLSGVDQPGCASNTYPVVRGSLEVVLNVMRKHKQEPSVTRRIGSVSWERVMKETALAKDAMSQFTRMFNKTTTTVQQEQKEIDERTAAIANLTGDTAEAQREDLKRRQEALKHRAEQAKAALTQRDHELFEIVFRAVVIAANEFDDVGGISAIIQKPDKKVLYGPENIDPTAEGSQLVDLTDAVIKRMDARQSTVAEMLEKTRAFSDAKQARRRNREIAEDVKRGFQEREQERLERKQWHER